MAPKRGECVALVLDTAPSVWTSLDEFHWRLSRALIARGVNVLIIYAAAPPDWYAERIRSTGALIAVLNYCDGKAAFFKGLGRLFRQHRVAWVQTRGFNYFTLLWWMLRLRGVRRILFVEGNSGLLRATSWKKLILRIRSKLMTYPVTHTATVSGFVKKQLLEVGFRNEFVTPIHNGVDLERFRPDREARRQFREENGIRPDEVIVSTISYLRPFKNPHIVLEACARLVKRDIPVHLFVAGDGELLKPMKELSHSLGIASQTHWLGNYPRSERLLQASDVFVLASVGEAFANALLEAMACGVPGVGSDSGGTTEVIEHGETGFLAPPLDIAAFAEAIGKLAKNPALRQAMSERSVSRARERFDVDLTVRNYLRLYDSML